MNGSGSVGSERSEAQTIFFRSTLGCGTCRAISIQDKIDLAGFQIDAHQLDPEPVPEAVALTAALAQQHMLGRIKVEIVTGQLRNMHEALHINAVQRDEQAKTGYAADNAIEAFTNPVLHVIAFKPCLYITGGVIRTALCL